jgi:hypothetical protein
MPFDILTPDRSISDAKLLGARRRKGSRTSASIAAGSGSSSITAAAVDGETVVYNPDAEISLAPGTAAGQTWEWDGSGWTLTIRPTGSGTANRIAKWVTATQLGSSPFITSTGTVALGPELTAEPTDTFLHINAGQTAGYSALKLTSNYQTNDVAALVIESASQGGGARITQTGTMLTPVGDVDPAAALTLVNTNARALGLDIVCTVATNPKSRGARITMPAGSGGVGLEVTDYGGGGAIRAYGSGGYSIIVGANPGATGTTPLFVQGSSTSTVPTIDVNAGGAIGLRMQRTASASGPLMQLANNSGTATGVELTHTSTGVALDLIVTRTGTNPAARITSDTTGVALEIAATRTSSTASAAKITNNGTGTALDVIAASSGRVASLRRTVAGSAPGLRVALEHSSDTGNAVEIVSNSSAAALAVTNFNGNGAEITVDGTSTALEVVSESGFAAVFMSTAGTGEVYLGSAGASTIETNGRVHITNGTGVGNSSLLVTRTGTGGWAIYTNGTVNAQALRIRDGSPDVGMVPIYQNTSGDLLPGYVTIDPECLVSIVTGSNALGTIGLAPLDTMVQVPLDTFSPVVCNDQWDTSSNLGGFTPAKNMDPTGATTSGVVTIEARLFGQIPAGYTASDMTLWLRKVAAGGGGATVNYRIDTQLLQLGTGGTRFHLHGVFTDKFTGSDTYTLWVSQNIAGAPATLTTWEARVATTYQHTDACTACLP